MASETQNGTAVVHGISNSGSAITMTGYATFTLESVKGSHKFDLGSVKDEAGYDKALIATNGYVEIDVGWTPSGATKANAANTAVYTAPLAKVVLANFKVAAFNGDWVYVGDESIDLNAGQPGKMSLKLRKYDDSSQNASLTTAAT